MSSDDPILNALIGQDFTAGLSEIDRSIIELTLRDERDRIARDIAQRAVSIMLESGVVGRRVVDMDVEQLGAIVAVHQIASRYRRSNATNVPDDRTLGDLLKIMSPDDARRVVTTLRSVALLPITWCEEPTNDEPNGSGHAGPDAEPDATYRGA